MNCIWLGNNLVSGERREFKKTIMADTNKNGEWSYVIIGPVISIMHVCI